MLRDEKNNGYTWEENRIIVNGKLPIDERDTEYEDPDKDRNASYRTYRIGYTDYVVDRGALYPVQEDRMTNIAILLPYPAQYDEILPLVKAVRTLLPLSIERAYNETVVQRAMELEEEGCELIIARGVQAHLLRERATIPLVELKVTTQELGMVILEIKKKLSRQRKGTARGGKLRIGLIGYANMFHSTEHFNELFDIELYTYFVGNNAELPLAVEQAQKEGCHVVIGGDTACGRAEELGIPNYKIPAGLESIRNALETAGRVSYAIELAKTNNAEMDAMLNNTVDGIMQVDREGVIQRINRSGYDFLEYRMVNPIGKKVTQILPGLKRKDLDEALNEGHETYSVHVSNRNKETVVNIAPIVVGNVVQGAVLTLQEGRRIIEMDNELRKELYQRGFIANFTIDQLYKNSRETSEIAKQVKKIAPFQAPVLIIGEKGTGADYIAEAIHNESLLKNSAFVPVDCDAWMPETLDDMLFGNYSTRANAPLCLAELAADGTLYLSNIEMLSRESQYKMLNLIRGKFMHNGSHRVSFSKVRVIASTSTNLISKVEKGEFRQDLYYALSSLSLELPPLRHQKEYIRYWFDYYIDQWQKQYKRYIHLTQGAFQFVENYDWPGNLEQLASVSERIILLTEKRTIDEVFIRRQIEQIQPAVLPGTEKVVLYKDKEAVRIAELLRKHSGNREKVAAELGISKTTLWRHIKKYGIEKDYSF